MNNEHIHGPNEDEMDREDENERNDPYDYDDGELETNWPDSD